MRVDYSGFREVSSPLTRAMLSPLPRGCARVQTFNNLTDRDWRSLASLLERHSRVALRVYGDTNRTIADLEFLRFFPRLRHFSIDIWHLEDFRGLVYLPNNLMTLGLGDTRSNLPDLELLGRFI